MALIKAKLVEALYLPHNDTVLWEVETSEGVRHKLLYKRQDFGPAVGVNADVPAKIVMEFNEKRVGKDVTVDIGGAGPVPEDYFSEPNQ